MSRTDKDAPYWVDTWWEPWHGATCQRGGPCGLPAEPDGKAGGEATTRWKDCLWVPQWPAERRSLPGPPRWYRKHRWYASDRFRARNACSDAAAEHRAAGEVVAVPPTAQHRHNATWDWW